MENDVILKRKISTDADENIAKLQKNTPVKTISLDQLHLDLYPLIIKHLDSFSAIRLSEVSSFWRKNVNQDGVWKHFLNRDFPELFDKGPVENENPKEQYIRILRELLKKSKPKNKRKFRFKFIYSTYRIISYSGPGKNICIRFLKNKSIENFITSLSLHNNLDLQMALQNDDQQSLNSIYETISSQSHYQLASTGGKNYQGVDGNGNSLLHWAVWTRQTLEEIESLRENNCPWLNTYPLTPLDIAMLVNYSNATNYFLKQDLTPADLNPRCQEPSSIDISPSAVEYMLMNKNLEFYTCLFKKGAQVHFTKKDANGSSILHWVCMNGDIKTLEFIEKYWNTNRAGYPHHKLVYYLFERMMSKFPPAYLAVMNTEFFNYLLTKFNQDRTEVLKEYFTLAVMELDFPMLNFLKTSIDLESAIKNVTLSDPYFGSTKMLLKLRPYDADNTDDLINISEEVKIYKFIIEKHAALTINFLLQSGINVNEQYDDDNTILHYIFLGDDPRSMFNEINRIFLESILKYNPDLKLENTDGKTAIQLANECTDKNFDELKEMLNNYEKYQQVVVNPTK